MGINMAQNKGGKGGNTVLIATNLIMPLIEERELILWDLKFEKEGSLWILRVIIDKESGINIEDCEDLSRPFDKLLDLQDPIEQSYCLEVSSAGLERELSKQWHFDCSIGKKVVVRLIRPLDGERDFVGELKGFCDNVVTIVAGDGTDRSFKMDDAAYVRYYVEF